MPFDGLRGRVPGSSLVGVEQEQRQGASRSSDRLELPSPLPALTAAPALSPSPRSRCRVVAYVPWTAHRPRRHFTPRLRRIALCASIARTRRCRTGPAAVSSVCITDPFSEPLPAADSSSRPPSAFVDWFVPGLSAAAARARSRFPRPPSRRRRRSVTVVWQHCRPQPRSHRDRGRHVYRRRPTDSSFCFERRSELVRSVRDGRRRLSSASIAGSPDLYSVNPRPSASSHRAGDNIARRRLAVVDGSTPSPRATDPQRACPRSVLRSPLAYSVPSSWRLLLFGRSPSSHTESPRTARSRWPAVATTCPTRQLSRRLTLVVAASADPGRVRPSLLGPARACRLLCIVSICRHAETPRRCDVLRGTGPQMSIAFLSR